MDDSNSLNLKRRISNSPAEDNNSTMDGKSSPFTRKRRLSKSSSSDTAVDENAPKQKRESLDPRLKDRQSQAPQSNSTPETIANPPPWKPTTVESAPAKISHSGYFGSPDLFARPRTNSKYQQQKANPFGRYSTGTAPWNAHIKDPGHRAVQQPKLREPSPVALPKAQLHPLTNPGPITQAMDPRPVYSGQQHQAVAPGPSPVHCGQQHPDPQGPAGSLSSVESPFNRQPNIPNAKNQISQPPSSIPTAQITRSSPLNQTAVQTPQRFPPNSTAFQNPQSTSSRSQPAPVPTVNNSPPQPQPKTSSESYFPDFYAKRPLLPRKHYVWNFIRETPLQDGVPIHSSATWTRELEEASLGSLDNPPRMSYRWITNALATQIANLDGNDREVFTSWLQSACRDAMIYHFSDTYRIERDLESAEDGEKEVLCLKLGVSRPEGYEKWSKEAEILLRYCDRVEESGSISVVQQIVKINVYVEKNFDDSWSMECEDIVSKYIDADRFPMGSRKQLEKHMDHRGSNTRGVVVLAYFDSVSVKKDDVCVNVGVVRLEKATRDSIKWREFQILTTRKSQSSDMSRLRVKDVGRKEWDEEKSIQALTRLPQVEMLEALLWFEDIMESARRPERVRNTRIECDVPPAERMYSMMFGMVLTALHHELLKSGDPRNLKLLSTVAFEMVPASERYREFDFISNQFFLPGSSRWYNFHRSVRFKASGPLFIGSRIERRISGLNQFLDKMQNSSVIEALGEYCTKKRPGEENQLEEDRIVRDIRLLEFNKFPGDQSFESNIVLIESVAGMLEEKDGASYSETFIIPGKYLCEAEDWNTGWVTRDSYKNRLSGDPLLLNRGFTVKVLEEAPPSGLRQSELTMSAHQILHNLRSMEWEWNKQLLLQSRELERKSPNPERAQITLCYLQAQPHNSATVIAQFRDLSDTPVPACGTRNRKGLDIFPFRFNSAIRYAGSAEDIRHNIDSRWEFLHIKWDAAAERDYHTRYGAGEDDICRGSSRIKYSQNQTSP